MEWEKTQRLTLYYLICQYYCISMTQQIRYTKRLPFLCFSLPRQRKFYLHKINFAFCVVTSSVRTANTEKVSKVLPTYHILPSPDLLYIAISLR